MLGMAYGPAARRLTPALAWRAGWPRAAQGGDVPAPSQSWYTDAVGQQRAEGWRLGGALALGAVNSPDILCALRVSDSSAAEAEASQRRGSGAAGHDARRRMQLATSVPPCRQRPRDAAQQVQRLASRGAEMWSCAPGVSSCVPRTQAQLHVPGPFLPFIQRSCWNRAGALVGALAARGRTGDARVGRGEHMPEPRACWRRERCDWGLG